MFEKLDSGHCRPCWIMFEKLEKDFIYLYSWIFSLQSLPLVTRLMWSLSPTRYQCDLSLQLVEKDFIYLYSWIFSLQSLPLVTRLMWSLSPRYQCDLSLQLVPCLMWFLSPNWNFFLSPMVPPSNVISLSNLSHWYRRLFR